MPEADAPLVAEFEPATRAAWLALVAKVLKGGDFEKRLVSRRPTVPISRYYTPPRVRGRRRKQTRRPPRLDVRQSLWRPIPRPPTLHLEDLTRAPRRPAADHSAGGGALERGGTRGEALKGYLDGCASRSTRAKPPRRRGSLLAICARPASARMGGRALHIPAGRAGQDGTLYYRRIARARSPPSSPSIPAACPT